MCLPPQEPIVCFDGIKPISDVVENDLVLTHEGRFMPVTAVMKRPYSGNLVSIAPVGSYKGISMTPEHPVLADLKNHTSRYVGNYISEPFLVENLDWFDSREFLRERKNHIKLFTAYPRPRMTDEEIDLKEDSAKVIGYYLAEGCLFSGKHNRKSIKFYFGRTNKEINLAEDLKNSLDRLGMKVKMELEPHRYGIYVECIGRSESDKRNKKDLYEFLMKNFGKGAANKFIPGWVLSLKNEVLAKLLDCYMYGDGWYSEKYKQRVAVTVSEKLAIGIRLIGLRLGYAASIQRFKGREFIEGRKVNSRPVYRVILSPGRRNDFKGDDKFLYSPAKRCDLFSYNGYVYNIEVAEDNSYCTPWLSVHNCSAWKKMDEKKIPFRQAIKEGWQDVKKVCAT
jgi:intein/homing endonuclease